MDITAAIDVAIGLVLMYLVLSLFCTSINEFIATLLRLRANKLRDALTQLIDDPNLKQAFDLHGLIDTAKIAASGAKKSTTPTPPPGTNLPPPQGWLSRVWSNSDPSYLSSRTVALALIGSLDPTKPIPGIADVESAVKALPDCNIKDVLLAALTEAQGDIQKVRDSIAAWFDASMERLSGAYKRNLQLISLMVGLAIAIAFNADTLQIGNTLWSDRALSQTISSSAAAFVNDCATKNCTNAQTPATPAAALDNLAAQEATLRIFPVGWSKQTIPTDWVQSFEKAFGLILTTIALAMGAPFWFDILQKVMNLRATGGAPVKQV